MHLCTDGTVTYARALRGYRADLYLDGLIGRSILDHVTDPQKLLETITDVITSGRATTTIVHLHGRRIPRVVRLVPRYNGVTAYVFKKKKKTIGHTGKSGRQQEQSALI